MNLASDMAIELMVIWLAPRCSKRWATEIPNGKHIQVHYHLDITIDNIAITWLSGCSDWSLGMVVHVKKSSAIVFFYSDSLFLQ